LPASTRRTFESWPIETSGDEESLPRSIPWKKVHGPSSLRVRRQKKPRRCAASIQVPVSMTRSIMTVCCAVHESTFEGGVLRRPGSRFGCIGPLGVRRFVGISHGTSCLPRPPARWRPAIDVPSSRANPGDAPWSNVELWSPSAQAGPLAIDCRSLFAMMQYGERQSAYSPRTSGVRDMCMVSGFA
jgi:hypothetical protein